MMETSASNRQKFIWNMLGSLSNALSTFVLSIAVNRILGNASGGIFAFAYANAQLMMIIGGFEVRPYQSTDVQEKYPFRTYFTLRLLSCALMIAGVLIYTGVSRFPFEKSCVIIFFTLFKMVEAFADVFGGRFQQKDRIDLSGKLFFYRVVFSTLVFILSLKCTKSLILSSFGMFLTSMLLFAVNDRRYIFAEDKNSRPVPFAQLFPLILEALPLFIGNFMMNFTLNIPKYTINRIYGDEMQNIYNILFMPAFVINLFSTFIFRPLLISMALNWKKQKLGQLSGQILKMYGLIVATTAMALIGTALLGIPLLSLVYHIDLHAYRMDLLFVMSAGGISAIVTFSYYVITVIRQQKWILVGYAAGLLCALLAAPRLIASHGITGAIFSYAISIAAIAVLFISVIVITCVSRLFSSKTADSSGNP